MNNNQVSTFQTYLLDDEEILCPRCCGNNLHHIGVHVYARKEDSRFGDHVHITQQNKFGDLQAAQYIDTNTDISGNQSVRRGSVVIEFNCEHCSEEAGLVQLAIVQHKGCTYLQWVNPID